MSDEEKIVEDIIEAGKDFEEQMKKDMKQPGYLTPVDTEGEKTYWQVTTADGGFYHTDSQDMAYQISLLEEVKANLSKLTCKVEAMEQESQAEKAQMEENRKKAKEMIKHMSEDNPILSRLFGHGEDSLAL